MRALRPPVSVDLTVTVVRESAGFEMAPLERSLSLFDHEVVREGVVPDSTRVGATVEGSLEVPDQFDAALIVLAIVLGSPREDAPIYIATLQVGSVNVEVKHAKIVEHADSEVDLE